MGNYYNKNSDTDIIIICYIFGKLLHSLNVSIHIKARVIFIFSGISTAIKITPYSQYGVIIIINASICKQKK